jgi:hypothetical protein
MPDFAFDLSIVIVNWNSFRLLEAAIDTLVAETSGVSYEIVVVDNGSTRDGSGEKIPGRFPGVRFIRNDDNLGFSKANNQAFAVARGRHLLTLNADTRQVENAVGKAYAYLESHPEVGALGILHLNDDAGKTPQASWHAFPRPLDDLRGLLHLNRKSAAAPEEPRERDVPWACASFLLVRRECLDQIGWFDERFFIYDEDIDWNRRMGAAGWKIRFWPGARFVHVGSASGALMSDKTFSNLRSRLIYYRKHHGIGWAVLLYLVVVAKLSAGALRESLRGGKDAAARWRRVAQFARLRSSKSGV